VVYLCGLEPQPAPSTHSAQKPTIYSVVNFRKPDASDWADDLAPGDLVLAGLTAGGTASSSSCGGGQTVPAIPLKKLPETIKGSKEYLTVLERVSKEKLHVDTDDTKYGGRRARA